MREFNRRYLWFRYLRTDDVLRTKCGNPFSSEDQYIGPRCSWWEYKNHIYMRSLFTARFNRIAVLLRKIEVCGSDRELFYYLFQHPTFLSNNFGRSFSFVMCLLLFMFCFWWVSFVIKTLFFRPSVSFWASVSLINFTLTSASYIFFLLNFQFIFPYSF